MNVAMQWTLKHIVHVPKAADMIVQNTQSILYDTTKGVFGQPTLVTVKITRLRALHQSGNRLDPASMF